MTWAKYGTEFSDDCANVGLSDAAYRTHSEAINWLYLVERTDVRIPKRLAARIMCSPNADDAVIELVSHGWWSDRGEHWELRHHADVVRSSIVTQQKARGTSKVTSRRHRAKKTDETPRRDTSADTSRDTSRRQTDKQHLRGVEMFASGLPIPDEPPSEDELPPDDQEAIA